MDIQSEKNELSIQLMGIPQISLAGSHHTFRYAKASALVYYLATTGQTQTRTHLVNLMWPESTHNVGRRVLRNRLVEVRRVLDAYLHITPDELALTSTALEGVDLQQLMRDLDHAQTPLENNRAVGWARNVVDRYRGDFLDGFMLPDAPNFNEWVDGTRDGLSTQVTDLLYQLAERMMAVGNHAQAHVDSDRLLTMVPWHEEAHQLKMKLLYQDGQRWAALEQYATLTTVLHRELDVTPNAESERLAERIRAVPNDPSPTVAAHELQAPVQLSSPNQAHPADYHEKRNTPTTPICPAPLTPLWGQDDFVASTIDYLCNPRHRLVTLLGMGGVGKTHLALTVGQFQQWAAKLTDEMLRISFLESVLVNQLIAEALKVESGFIAMVE
ncbi:MAG: BTAD domain-containing putative transcriptional regulator [Chloroflexota bacterium]